MYRADSTFRYREQAVNYWYFLLSGHCILNAFIVFVCRWTLFGGKKTVSQFVIEVNKTVTNQLKLIIISMKIDVICSLVSRYISLFYILDVNQTPNDKIHPFYLKFSTRKIMNNKNSKQKNRKKKWKNKNSYLKKNDAQNYTFRTIQFSSVGNAFSNATFRCGWHFNNINVLKWRCVLLKLNCICLQFVWHKPNKYIYNNYCVIELIKTR